MPSSKLLPESGHHHPPVRLSRLPYLPIETLASGRTDYDFHVEVANLLVELREAIAAIPSPQKNQRGQF